MEIHPDGHHYDWEKRVREGHSCNDENVAEPWKGPRGVALDEEYRGVVSCPVIASPFSV